MSANGESNTPKRPRRDKYISRACRACQRRKSKCSGHDPCLSCQGRDLICTYNTEKRRSRKLKSNLQRRVPVRRALASDGGDLHTPEPLEILPPTNQESIGDVQAVESSSDRPVHANTTGAARTRTSLYRSIGYDPNRISLRSQILDARAVFKGSEDLGYDRRDVYRGETYPVDLPARAEIEDSLHLYFEDTARQYPAIHPANTISRIHGMLEYLKYPSSGGKVYIDHVAAPTIALLCIIIAIARSTGNDISHLSPDRSMSFRNHARSLLQTFEILPPSLEILRCHTLITIYLLHMNLLDLALQSIAVTVRLAMTLRLHRQDSPSENGSDSYDLNLWRTVYILDRDIACLGGTGYLIRDEEIDLPQSARQGHLERLSSVACTNNLCEIEEQDRPKERSSNGDAAYLEVLAQLGRLWGRIWNDLFANNSESQCQWETAELLDTHIRIFQQRLPPEFIWRGLRDLEHQEEIGTQRQLALLMRTNTLRLLIRRNPVSNCTCLDQKAPRSDGVDISAQTIAAIASLGARRETLVPIGQTISINLVQCILYLVNIIGELNNTRGAESASASVVSAYQILIKLSECCFSAKEAVETLDAGLFRDDVGSSQTHTHNFATATLPQQHGASQPAGLEETPAGGQGLGEKQHDASNLTKQIPHQNDLFGCLQERYESLDSLLPSTVPKP